MMLLGASAQGGVRTLSEWDIEETRSVAEQNAVFDDYLRSQGAFPGESPGVDDEVGAMRDRLRAATGRLARQVAGEDQKTSGNGRPA